MSGLIPDKNEYSLTGSKHAVFSCKSADDDPLERRASRGRDSEVTGMNSPCLDVITKSVGIVLILARKNADEI